MAVKTHASKKGRLGIFNAALVADSWWERDAGRRQRPLLDLPAFISTETSLTAWFKALFLLEERARALS